MLTVTGVGRALRVVSRRLLMTTPNLFDTATQSDLLNQTLNLLNLLNPLNPEPVQRPSLFLSASIRLYSAVRFHTRFDISVSWTAFNP